MSTKFVFTEGHKVFFDIFSFPFHRTRHGGVGQRSGTRLETPLLGWALPLKILNHVSLGVDVPVFFHPGDVASFSYFFSLFRSTLSGYLIHNSITNLLVIKALLFDWVAHSLKVQTVQGFVHPCPFARTGWLLAQQPSTRFRVPCSGLRVTPFYCFWEFLHNFTITFQIVLITNFQKIINLFLNFFNLKSF